MLNIANLQFDKYENGLLPAIIQDANSLQVLMLGFMNEEAIKKTLEENKVTFFSRSKNRLWTKGEESGNFLYVEDVSIDCDQDTLLIQATPAGPVCHTGTTTCWGNPKPGVNNFLFHLEQVIEQRRNANDPTSYTKKLFEKGINKVAQKVGEEAVELVIEAKDNNDELFINEAADLLFHYLMLLQAKDKRLKHVIEVLQKRSK